MNKYIVLVLLSCLCLSQVVNGTCNDIELTYKLIPKSYTIGCGKHNGPTTINYQFSAKTVDLPYTMSIGTYPKDMCINVSSLTNVQETVASTTDSSEYSFNIDVPEGFQPGMFIVCNDRQLNCTLDVRGQTCTSASNILKSSPIFIIGSLLLMLLLI